MKKTLLKNIVPETILKMDELVTYQKGQVVSRTLAQNSALSLTLFAFDEGEEISSHSSDGDAMVYLLDGNANVMIGDAKYDLSAGETIVMPAGIPHALSATKPFKMLLIVVF